MSNLLGLLVSVVYIAIVLGLSTICYNKKQFTQEETRKFIHIGLCNWWLIAWIFFDNFIVASILPAIFVIVNACNYKMGFIKGMEPEKKEKKNLGTVWYAVSLLILSIILFRHQEYLYVGAIGILILGYGDGLAALIGSSFGKHKLDINQKSVEGSFALFVTSFVISLLLLQSVVISSNYVAYALFIAAFAMMIEIFSPNGIDNLTLPLGVSLVTYLVIKYTWFHDIAIAFTITSFIVFGVMVKRLLTPSASLCALVLGTALYVLAGPIAFGALILFFLTSSIIEHYHHKPLQERQRNLDQVQENSLAAVLLAIMYYVTGSDIALTACFVAIAGATADTWSSGIGYYSNEPVKSILTNKPLPKGESGGITKLGTLGGALGALLIASFSLLSPGHHAFVRFIIVFVFGFLTTILDSIFGVFLQAKYYDKEKGVILEEKPKNMKNIERVSGYQFLTNGMVNMITIMLSSILSCLFGLIIW